MTQLAAPTAPRPSRGRFIQAAVQFVDDRMNPIVVKELRQAVQSRFVTVVLVLFLAVELFTIAAFMLASDNIGADFQMGRNVFVALEVMLLGTCLLFVPLYAGIRLAAERSATNVDLLFITTIRPASIIWGKFLAGLIVTVLIYSVCAPFMVLTYLLRGIDIPTILLVLGIDLLVIIATMQLALLVASMRLTLVLKILLAILAFNGVIGLFSLTVSLTTTMLYFGGGPDFGSWDFWGPALPRLTTCLAGIGLMFFFSVALISPPSSNRALGVRLYLTLVWVVSGAICYLIATMTGEQGYILAWSTISVLLFSLMLFIVINERDVWTSRLLRTVPKRAWLRPLAFLFYSGSAGGVILFTLLIAASLVVLYYYHHAVLFRTHEFMLTWSNFSLYCLCYALSGVLLVRYALKKYVAITATFVISLFLMTLAVIVPPLVTFFIDPSGWDHGTPGWLIANPLGVFYDSGGLNYQYRCLWFTSVWAAAVVVMCLPWAFRQMRNFKPLGSLS